MKWPVVQFHLVDKQTGKFLAFDRHGEDGVFVKVWGHPFILSFDDVQMMEAKEVANKWGRPVVVYVSVDGVLM